MNEESQSPWCISVQTLSAVACYMAARFLIYRFMPIQDFDSWFQRDVVMTVPRLGGFAACLYIASRNGGLKQWGWTASLSRRGGAVLITAAVMEIFMHLVRGSNTELGSAKLMVGWLSTGPVALFEEAAFRSLLFLALRRKMSPLLAALLSSFAFALYHVQAQPLSSWPHLLAFGLGTCAALHVGTGVVWLVATHWFVDGVWFHLAFGPGKEWAALGHYTSMLVAVILSLIILRGPSRETWTREKSSESA